MSSGDSQEQLGARKGLELVKVLEELRNSVRELGVRAVRVHALDARSGGGCGC